MKYIRTKDGVYEVYTKDLDLNDKTHRDIAGFRAQHCRGWNYPLKPKDIVKVVDTIEELCDSFVMFCPNAHRRKIRVYETMHSISLYSKRDKRWNGNMVDKVYGAIWTDKGLIYVAKMNKKGELELL